MSNQIATELRQIKTILAEIIGSTELPVDQQFSAAAIAKAAKEFQQMKIARGDWVKEDDLVKYFKGVLRPGKFIIAAFAFTNYFKRGHDYYFNKKDVVALSLVLKEKNIDLNRYMEYKRAEAEFKKKVTGVKKTTRNATNFKIPAGLKDITTSPIPLPDAELIRKDIAGLKEEFFLHKMADYVDIYQGNHAMLKLMYMFEKYLEPKLKSRCKKWRDNFNYANHALELVTKEKEIFVPVKDEDMIQL